MKLKAFSIYDRKAMIYNTPYFSNTDATAVRSFTDLVNDRQSAIFNHPGDYVLYLVGDYDDQTGQLVPQVPLLHISDAEPLKRVEKRDYFQAVNPFNVGSDPVRPNGEDK